jgi:prophage antirepressor-like protein
MKENRTVVPFAYENGAEIRTTVINNDTWFVAKDVCDVLGIKDPSMAVSRLADYQKTTTTFNGTGSNYKTQALVISESGLYKLVFRSNKPQAEAFSRWVTETVLPSIRKTGAYGVVTQSPVAALASVTVQPVWLGEGVLGVRVAMLELNKKRELWYKLADVLIAAGYSRKTSTMWAARRLDFGNALHVKDGSAPCWYVNKRTATELLNRKATKGGATC